MAVVSPERPGVPLADGWHLSAVVLMLQGGHYIGRTGTDIAYRQTPMGELTYPAARSTIDAEFQRG